MGGNGLDEYERKRNFTKTTEPRGGFAKNAGGIFTVQKHAARTLHYDLRLELDGVLKSWAIPKGPSLNPEDKRLAVHVEDHPLEYASFEGIIPKGEYGGGTVMLWDQGFWFPIGNPHEGISKGALKFILCGKKLKGKWALVKLKESEEGKDEWLLVKEHDEVEVREITEEEPLSAATGRSIKEIAEAKEAVWTGDEVPKAEGLPGLPGVPGAEKKELPRLLKPELATLVDKPPPGDNWLHEIKYDGYRILSRVHEGVVELYTRNGNNWTGKFPSIAEAVKKIPLKEAWLDGEIVFLKEDGTTSFDGIQDALSAGTDKDLTYFIFDISFFNGYSLVDAPLSFRKELVKALLESAEGKEPVRFSSHVEGRGAEFFESACGYRVEGIISKRRDSKYREGRSSAWLKMKCHKRQEFVIGGYTEPGGTRKGFGALLTGVYDPEGRLIYTGRVGTGFNEKSLAEVWEKVKGLEVDKPLFSNPPTGIEAKGVHWVRPELVVEIEFSEWTTEGIIRHASFQGLRGDKPPREVVRERPESLTEAATPQTKERVKIKLTNPDKIYYPDKGITKKDLVDYYEMVSELMLPHLAGRPLTLVRCPEGYDKECFFQKHSEQTMPKELRRIDIKENEGGIETYLIADDIKGLLGLVQMGVLEIHTWGSRAEALEFPDKIVFDIDPDPSLPWERLVESAILLREVLREIGLESFPKTTGGKGMHIVIPLLPERDWEEVKAFTKAVAEYIAKGLPERFTSMMTKSRRTGKIFIDYMRNIRGATAIEAYSTRAKAKAPVAAPISWEELLSGVRSDAFTVENMEERIIGLTKDPWEGYFKLRQSITKEMKDRFGLK